MKNNVVKLAGAMLLLSDAVFAQSSCVSPPAVFDGVPVTGQFDRQGVACVSLPLNAQTYVRATLIGGGDLRLSDSQRRHLRTVISDMPVTTTNRGVFAVMEDGNYYLRLTGPAGGTWSLALESYAAKPLKLPLAPDIISPLIMRLDRQVRQGEGTASFWREVARSGSPLVEPYDADSRIVTFLWRSARQNVFILGAPSGDHDPLYYLPGSDVWFRSYIVPKDTLMSYRLAPDVPVVDDSPMAQRRAILITAQADPLNPQASPAPSEDRYNHASLLNLSGERVCRQRIAPGYSLAGTLHSESLASAILNNRRAIAIYQPPGDHDDRRLVILFDGQTYLKKYRLHEQIDVLIRHGALPPVTLVFVDSLDGDTRGRELPPNPSFADFLVHELLPWLAERGIDSRAARTVVAGSSYGGLASAWAAWRYPDRFGNVLSLSGSYWWRSPDGVPEWLIDQFAGGPRKPIRFYLEAGRFEQKGDGGGILANNRRLYTVLKNKGYDVSHVERSSGHDYIRWCEEIPLGLSALLD
ncbi:DUF3327 domain-containing protein [Affinibrenneria salicis]|uniref:DUF3327 domain-containing protein n=1 Tax=Affinibrenneria salicis TaxID=2590031 RepID=A0A5J5FVQ6_9GAMM|nr:alpha/beta hydrolase-fold protein [Affinibrenneria salicis]KAA8997710.1 DUF3327 domain-containing protein [Affinibrenneria salicis]